MRVRAFSSIGVVVVGLVPAFIGGTVFAVVYGLIFLIAYRELTQLLRVAGSPISWAGYPLIALGAALPLWLEGRGWFQLLMGLSLIVPAGIALCLPLVSGRMDELTASVCAVFYLILPTFALVSIRMTDGTITAGWLTRWTESWSPGWAAHPRGLAWLLTALLITWLSDTGAYMTGRSFGKRPLAPHISPKKTVEGAIGGLIAAAITAIICVLAFGLGLNPGVAALLGIGLSLIGIAGDLTESLIKRQSGVKDSGNLIPGHGGMLDRIDALVFVGIATWVALPVLERLSS